MKGHLAVLGFLVLCSALAVVYTKFRSRYLFTQIGTVELAISNYQVDWDKLQLERSTLAAPGRIEGVARGKLGFVFPKREEIVYLDIGSSDRKKN
ncbi:MAG: cell division protein FtsL [Methylococcales bacterium]